MPPSKSIPETLNYCCSPSPSIRTCYSVCLEHSPRPVFTWLISFPVSELSWEINASEKLVMFPSTFYPSHTHTPTLLWGSVMDPCLAFSATQQLWNTHMYTHTHHTHSGWAMSCLIPIWSVTVPAWPTGHTQVKPWVESQEREEGDLYKLSFLLRLIGEACGVQATGRGSSGVQHPGPVGCAAISGQGLAGWGLLAHSHTVVWVLCGGQGWFSAGHH